MEGRNAMSTPVNAGRTNARPVRRPAVRGGALLVAVAGLASVLGGWTMRERPADVDAIAAAPQFGRTGDLSDELDDIRGQIAVAKLQLDRANAILDYSARYQIPADLSASIFDIALSEGIDPSLGFKLVKVESNFKRSAKSDMGAVGYTQLKPSTARFYQPDIDEAQLLDGDVNLRIGFRFLKDMMKQFDGDAHLALLAYNRGPARVMEILAQGGDPANGYSAAVLQRYRPSPRGVTE
jgi:soluble lytic murein transglycosylase-like protein